MMRGQGMLATGTPGLRYVHRDGTDMYDYHGGALTRDGAFHTLNLSSIVPANAKLVHLEAGGHGASIGHEFIVKKTGQLYAVAASWLVTLNIYVDNTKEMIVDCTGQHVDYEAASGVWGNLYLNVLGWFI